MKTEGFQMNQSTLHDEDDDAAETDLKVDTEIIYIQGKKPITLHELKLSQLMYGHPKIRKFINLEKSEKWSKMGEYLTGSRLTLASTALKSLAVRSLWAQRQLKPREILWNIIYCLQVAYFYARKKNISLRVNYLTLPTKCVVRCLDLQLVKMFWLASLQ